MVIRGDFMYRIGLFSKITKVTIKALRYYDEIGLVVPKFVDDNGYRYYTTDQLTTIHQVIALKQLGLSIPDIQAIINGANIASILENREKELENQIKEYQDQLFRIKNILKNGEEDQTMEKNVIIKELPECIVYSKRTIIPSYDTYFSMIPALGEAVKAHNPDIKCQVPEYCFVIYHDGEYKEKDIDIEYCEAVNKMGKDFDDVKFKKIPAVKAACLLHKGPYRNLGTSYAYIFKWIEENGYVIADNPRESYIDGIWNKDSEEEWLTEIQVPIEKQ